MMLLIKVFVREFYLANSSFFLLVIAFAGGFMRSYDHIALAEFFISSPVVLSIPCIAWSLYAFKVMNYNLQIIKRNENEFVFCLPFLPLKEQWLMLLRVIALQLLPVFIYALFLCAMAWKHSILSTVVLIVITLSILMWTITYKFLDALRRPNREKKMALFTRVLNTKLTRPFPSFFIEWVARHELLMLLGTKAFSGLVLLAVTHLYKTDEYDLRLLGLGIAIAFAANVNLVYAMHRFDNYILGWMKGLPIAFFKRVLFFVATITTLLLPEIGVMLKNFPPGFLLTDLILSITFGISIPLFFYGLLYAKGRNQEQLMMLVFWCAIGWILLILFKIPLAVLSLVNVLAGLLLWRRFYYLFEYKSKGEMN